jgi:hypothetical protein
MFILWLYAYICRILGVGVMDEEILYRNEWGCLKVNENGLVYSRNGESCPFLLKPELDLLLESLYYVYESGKRRDEVRISKIAQLVRNVVNVGLERVASFGKKAKVEVKLKV